MNVNDVVTGINTASLIGGKLLNAASTVESVYDYFNGEDGNKLNSIAKRGLLAMKAYNNYLETNKIKGDEAYKITDEEVLNPELTPKKENFYVWAYNKGYFHIEELEDLGIDISKLSSNDLQMKELAIKLYYGGTKIPEGVDDKFEEWKENNGYVYEKILEAKENVKKQVEGTLDNIKPINNINYKGNKKNTENSDSDNNDDNDDDI